MKIFQLWPGISPLIKKKYKYNNTTLILNKTVFSKPTLQKKSIRKCSPVAHRKNIKWQCLTDMVFCIAIWNPDRRKCPYRILARIVSFIRLRCE